MLSPRRWLVAIVGSELLALYLLLNPGGWVSDDNLSLELAKQTGLTWDLLVSNLFGHFEPAHRAIFLLQLHLMPFSYDWVLIIMLLALGASALLFERICARLIGEGWLPVLAGAYLGISVLWIRPLQWWSTGLEIFPMLLLGLSAVWGYLRYQAEPRARWIVVSAGAIAAGLLFYEKPVYVPLYLLLVRILLLRGGQGSRVIAGAIWRERAVWLAYAGVVAGYVIVRAAVGAGSIGSGGAASVGQWASFYRVLWLNTLVPALFGLRTPASGLSTIQVLAVVVCQLLLAAVVLGSVARRPSLWRGWAALAVCFIVTGVLVGVGRLAAFGPSVANDQRYLVDFAWLVPLMLCAAGAGAARGRLRVLHLRRLPAGLAAVFAIYAAASIATAAQLQHNWRGSKAGVWENHVATELASIRRSQATPVVTDGVVPSYIVNHAFTPYDQLSYVLPIYSRGVHVDGPLTGPLFWVGDDGHLHRARLRTVTHFTGGCTRPAASVTGGIPTAIRSRMAFLRVTYAGSGELPLRVRGALDASVAPDRGVALALGARQSIAWLGGGRIRRFALTVPAHSGICVRSVDVVALDGASGK